MAPKRYPDCIAHLRGYGPGVMDGYGDVCKFTYHDEGVNRGDFDSRWLANYVNRIKGGYHYTYNWWDDDFVSLYDYDQASRACRNDRRVPWKGVNRRGKVNIQVCAGGMSATSGTKLSDKPMKPNWIKFTKWLTDVGVPQETHVNWNNPSRSWADWEKSGWTSHRHAPGNDHTDGSGLQVSKLWTPGQEGDCDDMEYRQISRGGKSRTLVVHPMSSRWIKWPDQEREGWHRADSMNVRPVGITHATLEFRSSSKVEVAFTRMKKGKVVAVDIQSCQQGRNLATNVMKFREGEYMRVRVDNRSTVSDLVVSSMQLRVSWCK